MNDSHKQTPKKMDHGSGHSIATCFGVIGWLFHGILSVITAGLIIMAIVGFLIYAKVKPELDKCREIAYDKLAQMERSDFSMLSDTLIYDKDGKQIGLINAGHYQYVDISKISMNLQNGYIAQEDRRFKESWRRRLDSNLPRRSRLGQARRPCDPGRQYHYPAGDQKYISYPGAYLYKKDR